jgi:hypothetical protein
VAAAATQLLTQLAVSCYQEAILLPDVDILGEAIQVLTTEKNGMNRRRDLMPEKAEVCPDSAKFEIRLHGFFRIVIESGPRISTTDKKIIKKRFHSSTYLYKLGHKCTEKEIRYRSIFLNTERIRIRMRIRILGSVHLD